MSLRWKWMCFNMPVELREEAEGRSREKDRDEYEGMNVTE